MFTTTTYSNCRRKKPLKRTDQKNKVSNLRCWTNSEREYKTSLMKNVFLSKTKFSWSTTWKVNIFCTQQIFTEMEQLHIWRNMGLMESITQKCLLIMKSLNSWISLTLKKTSFSAKTTKTYSSVSQENQIFSLLCLSSWPKKYIWK